MFTTIPGQLVQDLFSAFEDDGVSKRTGLTQVGGDFVVTVWKDAEVNGLAAVVTEVVGSPGEYVIEYTPPDEGIFVVEVVILFSGDVVKSTAAVGVVPDLTTLITRLDRAMGLLHLNSMLDKQEYNDPDGQLTKARLRVFNTESNVPPTPGGNEISGLVQEYLIEAEYLDKNKLKKYTLKKVL